MIVVSSHLYNDLTTQRRKSVAKEISSAFFNLFCLICVFFFFRKFFKLDVGGLSLVIIVFQRRSHTIKLLE